eukprot:6175297-Pleurochrysis_carterae.AAC.2
MPSLNPRNTLVSPPEIASLDRQRLSLRAVIAPSDDCYFLPRSTLFFVRLPYACVLLHFGARPFVCVTLPHHWPLLTLFALVFEPLRARGKQTKLRDPNYVIDKIVTL